jgi:hypothetical protein
LFKDWAGTVRERISRGQVSNLDAGREFHGPMVRLPSLEDKERCSASLRGNAQALGFLTFRAGQAREKGVETQALTSSFVLELLRHSVL